MRNCIFLEEKEPIIRQFEGKNKLKFVKRTALFKCHCGNEFTSPIVYIRNGNVKGCGCNSKTWAKEMGYKNKTHGFAGTPLYKVWKSMMNRCEKLSDSNYFRYGARGIKVCDRWKDVNNFIKDMSSGYNNKLQLDRIDNNCNYEPSNCRWATRTENANNTRRNRWVEYNNISKTVGQWATFLQIPYHAMINRFNNWELEKAINTPYVKGEKLK